MKKIFQFIFIYLCFCSSANSESYYFKGCKLSNVVTGEYIININKKIIQVNLRAADGTVQNFSDEIKSIEKDKIISEKIKSTKGKDIYYQYFLDAKSKSVIKLQYKKESGVDMEIFRINEKKESFCTDIKTDWNKKKIEAAEAKKEQKEILKAKEKLEKEQSSIIECQNKNYKEWNNCKGTYKAETGLKFKGTFKNGKIRKGISIYPGGARYIGEFKNFEPHGYGTFIWSNGDKYYGEWNNGKSEGNGTKIWKNGRKYLGTFKNDQLHGKGTLFYPDGKKYEGEFINGKRHGTGTFVYPDGTAYIGTFIAGNEEGVGECIDTSGLSIPCKSRTDTQVKDFSGKDVKNIQIVARKWVRISQYESNTKKGKKVMDKLKTDFELKAAEICASQGAYNTLEKKIEVLEIDETPAYGLETKLKIAITGVVECK
tara:strand:- start:288 stop:1571 length:1284 start_codon:yes stop_codon:yes gene_type:complete